MCLGEAASTFGGRLTIPAQQSAALGNGCDGLRSPIDLYFQTHGRKSESGRYRIGRTALDAVFRHPARIPSTDQLLTRHPSLERRLRPCLSWHLHACPHASPRLPACITPASCPFLPVLATVADFPVVEGLSSPVCGVYTP